MNAGLILYQNATNATPPACLLDSAGLPRGGGLSTFCVLLLPFSFFSPSFIVSLKANKADATLKEVWHVYSILVVTDKFSPLLLSIPNFPLTVLPSILPFYLYVSYTKKKQKKNCYVAWHTYSTHTHTHSIPSSHAVAVISYRPTWGPSSFSTLPRSCENVLPSACL